MHCENVELLVNNANKVEILLSVSTWNTRSTYIPNKYEETYTENKIKQI